MKSVRGKKILIIEDEPDVRGFYCEVLNDAGCEMIEAEDGQSGKEKMVNTDWDLMLLDIMLPDEDGMHLLEDMQVNPALKKGPVLILTNLNSEPVIKESFGLGADGYLVKAEIPPDHVLAEVAHYFESSEVKSLF